MNIENESQSIEVIPKKRKGHGGRPRKPLDEKRNPALMLRLNEKETAHLQKLIKHSGWTGDPSSFVRDFVLSESSSPLVDESALNVIEHYLTILHAYLTELEDELEESEKLNISHIKDLISSSAQAIYKNKRGLQND